MEVLLLEDELLLGIELAELVLEEFGHYSEAGPIEEEVELLVILFCSGLRHIDLGLFFCRLGIRAGFGLLLSCLGVQGISFESDLRFLKFYQVFCFFRLNWGLFTGFLFWFNCLVFLNFQILWSIEFRFFRALCQIGVGYLNFGIFQRILIDNFKLVQRSILVYTLFHLLVLLVLTQEKFL